MPFLIFIVSINCCFIISFIFPPALKYNFRLFFGFFPSFALKFFSPSASKSTGEVSSSMNLIMTAELSSPWS
ncbi:Uncharacterised protein [Segatella copri]|nr:Uncharacterised protein [Segatella copri]